MATLRELLQEAPIPRLENRLLLGVVTGWTAAQVLARDDYSLSEAQLQHYRVLCQRIAAGEPLAYVTGSKEFYSRLFKVTAATLIPRPETEALVDLVVQLAAPAAAVLDLGCGSGCIAISCYLERPDLQVTALDKFPAALAVATENARDLGAKVRLLVSDWCMGLADDERFDLIVSNPPYIEQHDEHLRALSFEPLSALTDFADGLSCLRQISLSAPQRLRSGGLLVVEHGYDQAAAVRELFQAAGLSGIATHLDYAGQERITLGRRD